MPEDEQVYTLTYEEMNLYHRLINEKYPNLFQHDYIPQSPDEWTARHVVRKITQPTIEEDDDDDDT